MTEQNLPFNVEDLEYVEKDLCYYELVSLGFLLYGENRANAEFVLQKLLVQANANASGVAMIGTDLLRQYALQINTQNWRGCILEALAIIGARRVLRKLGHHWQDVRTFYLPTIAELSVYVHPILKALYIMCERMKISEAGHLVLHINDAQTSGAEQHLRFYDFAYMEIFLLDWLTRGVIQIGDREMQGTNLDVLLTYFKLNEKDELKRLLLDTINSNASDAVGAANLDAAEDNDNAKQEQSIENGLQNMCLTRTCQLDASECYTVRREQAGILLIINQMEFHQETATEFKHLVPKHELKVRKGSDVDKKRLKDVFCAFGYKFEEHNNLTHILMLHTIRETVKRSLLYDSIIVCVLSHGNDGAVYGCNSVPVKIADIEQILTADTVQGKPKMLIIQACQTEEPSAVLKSNSSAAYLTPDLYVDILKAMSTVPGYSSYRYTLTGSWFIQSLCDAVQKYGDSKHLLDIFIAVTRDVSNKRGDKNEVMVPMTSNTLRKYFFLPQRDASHKATASSS